MFGNALLGKNDDNDDDIDNENDNDLDINDTDRLNAGRDGGNDQHEGEAHHDSVLAANIIDHKTVHKVWYTPQSQNT